MGPSGSGDEPDSVSRPARGMCAGLEPAALKPHPAIPTLTISAQQGKIVLTAPGVSSNPTELLAQMARLREQLETYRIRDNDGLAELLMVKALGGTRNHDRSHKGFDLVAPRFGRIEVHSRTLPRRRRAETRVTLQESKRHEFDWLSVVIFTPDLRIAAGYMLPHDAAWGLADARRYSRIPLTRAMAHPDVRDITRELQDAY
jgi:hypothetical protein